MVDGQWLELDGVEVECCGLWFEGLKCTVVEVVFGGAVLYLTYSDQYPTRESGDKVACLDKVLLSFVGLQCGSML